MGSIILIDPFAIDRDVAGGAPAEYEWQLVGSWDWTELVSEIEFTGLDNWHELMVRVERVIHTGGGSTHFILVSSNGGSTYYAANGDYKRVADDGQEFSVGSIIPQSSGFAATLFTSTTIIRNWGSTGVPKIAWCWEDGDNHLFAIDVTQSPLNALKYANASSRDFTGGSIRVYGR